MSERACERCEWVQCKRGHGSDGEGGRVPVLFFTCRLHPPSPAHGWPAVKAGDWCAQFMMREESDHAALNAGGQDEATQADKEEQQE